MSTERKRILVFGSTGPQGGAVVKHLAPTFDVLAVTRDPTSAAATKVASRENVKAVKYDTDHPELLFEHNKNLYGVFLVQNAFQEDEVKEGVDLIDLAVKYGVQHIVFSSVEFAGQDDTGLPYFETKRPIEARLRDPTHKITWTILRPTRFMDNWLRPDYLDVVLTEVNHTDKYKLLSGEDIGGITLEVFTNREEFSGVEWAIAGDELTTRQAAEVFERVKGKSLEVKTIEQVPVERRAVIKFNATYPFLADIKKNRERFPWLHTFESFLRDLDQEE